ncbi:MAG TPA: DNA glycosylase [Clostridia bacterium]|nr:DNA glycosylase [Clostridia bacterium]
MFYRGYEIEIGEERSSITGDSSIPRIIIRDVHDFDPVQVFECGQCFRWSREQDGSYTGVARGRAANVACEDGALILRNVTLDELDRVWFDYFDLGRDYSKIKEAVAVDDIMKEAVEFGSGIRLLRQEIWETVISFIVSANNNIPRIIKIINDISKNFGEELYYEGRSFFSFPGPKSLASCSLDQLKACRAGYRCSYINETAETVASGSFDLGSLAGISTDAARKALLGLKGVGGKVADCILLFSGTCLDVFPTDVWVKRVMEELYFKQETGINEIRGFALDYFGKYAGIAQQYLFYFAREHRIGV